jgi:hypothetical protein
MVRAPRPWSADRRCGRARYRPWRRPFGIDQAVIGGVRLVEGRETLGVVGPAEAPAIDNRAAKRGAMAAEELGQRMNGDVSAVVERLEQDRRRHRVVDHQRHAVTMRNLGQCLDIADISGRVPDRFGKHRSGVLVDQFLDRIGLVGFGKAGGDALARQDVAEQRMRGAVQLRHRNDIAADVGEIDDGKMQCRLAARDRQRADAAFELGDALFEDRGRRVGDPAVTIAFGFQVKEGCAMIGAVERVGCGLIDRNSDRLGGRIGFVASVNGDRFAAHRLPLRSSRNALQRAFFAAQFVECRPSSLQ